ncbi:MAG: hypothetical protein LM580_08710 [Thermofilum sp.]|nr:hypothetical protein [Thermofilum sp.]
MPRGNRAAGEQAVKGPEAPRAPEREIPRPMGAGVGARPKPIVLDGFALFLLGDPRDLPEVSRHALKELLGIDIDEVEREGARAEGGR